MARHGSVGVARSERSLFEFYLAAKEHVLRAGFIDEILWQETRTLDSLTEREFLCEAAWVVLSAGIAEHVVRRRFPDVSAAFHDWTSASDIAQHRSDCIERALTAFRHTGKIEAIASNCEMVARIGFQQIVTDLSIYGAVTLRQFRFIGPITACHLAKNIGLAIAKPDRHLRRMAACVGLGSPAELCDLICEMTGDPVAVVDLVLWRFATIARDYRDWITSSLSSKTFDRATISANRNLLRHCQAARPLRHAE